MARRSPAPRARPEFVDDVTGATTRSGAGAHASGRMIAKIRPEAGKRAVPVEVDPADLDTARSSVPVLAERVPEYVERARKVGTEPLPFGIDRPFRRSDFDVLEGRRTASGKLLAKLGIRSTFDSPEHGWSVLSELGGWDEGSWNSLDPGDVIKDVLDPLQVETGRKTKKISRGVLGTGITENKSRKLVQLAKTPAGKRILGGESSRWGGEIFKRLVLYLLGQARGRSWLAVDWFTLARAVDGMNEAIGQAYEQIPEIALVLPLALGPTEIEDFAARLQAVDEGAGRAWAWAETSAKLWSIADDLREIQTPSRGRNGDRYREIKQCLSRNELKRLPTRITQIEHLAAAPWTIGESTCGTQELTYGLPCGLAPLYDERTRLRTACERRDEAEAEIGEEAEILRELNALEPGEFEAGLSGLFGPEPEPAADLFEFEGMAEMDPTMEPLDVWGDRALDDLRSESYADLFGLSAPEPETRHEQAQRQAEARAEVGRRVVAEAVQPLLGMDLEPDAAQTTLDVFGLRPMGSTRAMTPMATEPEPKSIARSPGWIGYEQVPVDPITYRPITVPESEFAPLTQDEAALYYAVMNDAVWPVEKAGSQWRIRSWRGWGGFPIRYATKREADAQFQGWVDHASERWTEYKRSHPNAILTAVGWREQSQAEPPIAADPAPAPTTPSGPPIRVVLWPNQFSYSQQIVRDLLPYVTARNQDPNDIAMLYAADRATAERHSALLTAIVKAGVAEPYTAALGEVEAKFRAALEQPAWQLSADQYQARLGVPQPWIGEISPMQYQKLGKRARAAYDEKRRNEWSASASAKGRWKQHVWDAFKRSDFKLSDPLLHPEARKAAEASIREAREEIDAEVLRRLQKLNQLGPGQLKVGLSIFTPILGLGVITKILRKSIRMRRPGNGGREHLVPIDPLYRVNPADVAAQFKRGEWPTWAPPSATFYEPVAEFVMSLEHPADAPTPPPAEAARESAKREAENARAASQSGIKGRPDLVAGDGFRAIWNVDLQRVQVFNPPNPTADKREHYSKVMRGSGWVWSRKNGAWQRQLTENSWRDARSALKYLSGEEPIEAGIAKPPAASSPVAAPHWLAAENERMTRPED